MEIDFDVFRVLEVLATLTGILAVYLLSVGNGRGWPIGLVNVLLSGLVYYDSGVDGSTFLQVFFFGTQVWGWSRWRSGEEKDLRASSRSLPKWALCILLCLLAGAWLVGFEILQARESASTYTDAFVTPASVLAQILMVLSYWESWPLWLVVDIVFVVQSWEQELWAFVLLYLVYCGMAIRGWSQWTREDEGSGRKLV